MIGPKASVYAHKNYLVIVSPPIVPSATSASATVRNFAARTNYAVNTDITKVAVFDLENKHVAFSGTFNEGVREVISMFDKVYVLSNDGVVRDFSAHGLLISPADST